MMPLGMPTTSFSTRWPSRATSMGGHDAPARASSAVTVATSIAADDERLAPVGMSVSTVARHPPVGMPCSARRPTVPAMYLAHGSTARGSLAGSISTSPNPCDTMVTGPVIASPTFDTASTVSNGSAIGRVNPSL